jgi:predicted Zn-dependent protease
MLSKDDAREVAERLVERAIRAGADSADALYVGSGSTDVQVRLGELDHVNRSEGEDVGLRVFVGSRPASVGSSDLSPQALDELVSRALAMAAEAPEDAFAGYAPADLLARAPFADLDSIDPIEPDPAELRARALEAEKAALAELLLQEARFAGNRRAGDRASEVAEKTGRDARIEQNRHRPRFRTDWIEPGDRPPSRFTPNALGGIHVFQMARRMRPAVALLPRALACHDRDRAAAAGRSIGAREAGGSDKRHRRN